MAQREIIPTGKDKNEIQATYTRGKIIMKYKKYFNHGIDTVMTAHQGIPATVFYDVVALYGQQDLVAGLLNVSTKTFKRYLDQNKKLDASNSEMLLKLVAVFEKGLEVFGERTAFLRWLEKPAFGLGNNIPFNLMITSSGIDLVLGELVRIEYGDLA